jgi:CRP-like cAMP-binding protein
MPNFERVRPLVHNLQRYVRLSEDDKRAISQLHEAPMHKTKAREDIAREGQNPSVVRLMVSGWACRYKDLPDGRRQIVGLFIPGDFCDLNVYILKRMDHSIGAITPVNYVGIPPSQLDNLIHAHPRVGQALLWHELVQDSITREWLLNLGQRSAFERIAHLFMEMFMRMRAIEHTEGRTCPFPLTQSDLAEATGLTPVHINRTLQEMRREGLIELSSKRLCILDWDRLKEIAMFNPDYLHLDHEGSYLDANA